MTSFLTFALAAPLASFGAVAVGERRASGDRPAKSAVLGLVAGALGIEREDSEAHATLAGESFYAVRIEALRGRSAGRLMTDYHTIQTAPSGRNRRFATRREEVADRRDLGTILSYREYRSDCSFTIALWPRVSPPRFSLEQISEALRKPVFTSYAGRKACPLMLPMQPLIVEAGDVHQALERRDAIAMSEAKKDFLSRYGLLGEPRGLALDAEAAADMPGRRERRRDEVLDRSRWQFGLRDELVRAWNGGAA